MSDSLVNPETGSTFTTVRVKETGVKQEIPNAWLNDPAMMAPFELLASDSDNPSEKWSKDRLLAHAAANGVDVGSASTKGEILAAITAAAQ